MLLRIARVRSSFLKSSISPVFLVLCAVIFLYVNYTTWSLPNSIHHNTPPPLIPTTTPATTTGIPRILWYKHGPQGLSDQAKEYLAFCLKNNPGYESKLLTDESGDAYVQENFAAHRPDIVELYLSLKIPILKADLLRHLLLLREGGIWNDLDVSCGETPIDDWIPERYKKETDLVVGWEFDVGWGDNFVREFETWTIMAKQNSPHLSMVINDTVQGLHDLSVEKNVTISELTIELLGDGGVVDMTGPRRMTWSIMKSLKSTLQNGFEESDTYNLTEPMLVNDVLIMPGFSFAASSNHYAEDDPVGPALVTHHYAGSWKNEHGGETKQ
ncbi:hypothetical protein HYALB_00001870 [Hymenoscyphus albidus]|uniref:Glycosyltransferase family 32 protein n=1 Tax=Hymenoscyphus albidus TaxID=595503 RepID=A0A9N9LQI1_9HELO|nr:hypothetical protein HYALB_00001870 [Hymenoscyphus albidus]